MEDNSLFFDESSIFLSSQPEERNLPIIILMTRWHALTRCKKRLSAEIGAKAATKIQEKLTNHTIAVAQHLQERKIAEIKIAISGIGPQAARRWGQSKGLDEISIQTPGRLGTKMKKEIAKTHKKKTTKHTWKRTTIVIGSDLPTICHTDLIKAIHTLKHKDLVLGPSLDGGYWLIGISGESIGSNLIWPFSGIPWGSEDVLKETLRIAKRKGLKYELLREQNDLDKSSDLAPWQNN